MLTVAIYAPTPIVRSGLARMIAGSGRYRLGEVGDAPPRLPVGEGIDADVMVAALDPRDAAWDVLDGGDGFPAIVALASGWPGSWLIRQLERRGGALLSVDADAAAVFAAIDAASAGLVAIEPRAFARETRLHFGAEDAAPGEALTAREAEVLELLADGHSNKGIARLLNVSRHTAKFHVSAVLAKLGAATRTEAVALGIRRGLISL